MMSYSTKAVILLIITVGLVISYPSLTYPPIRKAARKLLWILGWPFRAIWRVCLWIAAAPIEWARYQREIPDLALAAEGKEQELALSAGRMWLETQLYTYKPRLLIANSDHDHGALAALHEELRAKTFGRPVARDAWFQSNEKAYPRPTLERWWQIDLWFAWAVWQILAVIYIVAYAIPRKIPRFRRRGYRWVKNLHGEWLSLVEQLAALRGLMEKIPDRTKIYDRLESAKEAKRRERKEQDRLRRPIGSIETEFEGAKSYIRRLQIRRRHPPTKGSEVLSLEDLLTEWQKRVCRIEQAQVEERGPEEIAAAIKSFVKDMSLAGAYGVKVVQVERRAQLVRSLHKRLKRRFPDVRLPDEEAKTITIIMREVVSQLWVAARWDGLTEALETVLEHVQAYESAVLGRAWELQVGSFEQLVAKVFGTGSIPNANQIRINPEVDAGRKKAAEGSNELSPFAEELRAHDSELSPRYAKRGGSG